MALSNRILPSQIGFGLILSAADCQPEICAQNSCKYDALLSLCDKRSNSVKYDRAAYARVKYFCPMLYSLLAAAKEFFAHNADALVETIKRRHVYDRGSKHQGEFDARFDPERVLRSVAPPKRFYGRLWKSVCRRLLDRQAERELPGLSSIISGSDPTPQEA
jgi:hypothetical protein